MIIRAFLITVIVTPFAIILALVNVLKKTQKQVLFRLQHNDYLEYIDYGHDLKCAQNMAFQRIKCDCDLLIPKEEVNNEKGNNQLSPDRF